MLDRPHRLTTPADFSTAIRGGRRAGTRTLVVHLATADEDQAHQPRVGFVVSKAVGNAVHRNLVKRRLRHLVRERLSSLPDGALLVVRALPGSSTATYDALGQDFDAAFRRVDRSDPIAGGVHR